MNIKNTTSFLMTVGSFLCSSLAIAVPTCLDYNATWEGTCAYTRPNGTTTHYASRPTVNFSNDCSRLTLTGVRMAAPGVQNMLVGKELVNYNYSSDYPGNLSNRGHQSVSAHFNHQTGGILVVSQNSLLAFMPNTTISIRGGHLTEMRFMVDGDELEIEDEQDNFSYINGGAQGKNKLKTKCKYTRVAE